MTIDQQYIGKYLVMALDGRLDATWSDFFRETCMGQIRSGHHHLIFNAEKMTFFSSAGIRAMMLVARELDVVKGSFSIFKASPFIEKTIRLTGLSHWLTEKLPDDIKGIETSRTFTHPNQTENFLIGSGEGLELNIPARWIPWQNVTEAGLLRHRFPQNSIALGIGSASENSREALKTLGDFLAVAGHLVYQPPEKHLRPDYLISKQDYVPEMYVIQLLEAHGDLTHHFRFAPDNQQGSFGIASLAGKVLNTVRSRSAVMVLLAEIHGLVGASVARSPALKTDDDTGTFPGIRDWVSFTGEPMYHGLQCLVAGFVSDSAVSDTQLLRPLPANPLLSGHFHAAIFPYQSLPNGKIDLVETIGRFFNGPQPLALMHLIDDQRPVQGTGESTFIRGACWCAPLKPSEDMP